MSIVSVAEVTEPDADLTRSESETVAAVAGRLADVARGSVDDPAFVAAARAAWDNLPVRLRQAVREFRRHSGPSGTLLVRGLPVDDLADRATPTADGAIERHWSVPAAALVMLACGLGDPAAFRPEKSGALVHDVVPVPGKESFQGNAGSALLKFHTENAFHEHRPDFVSLLCIRGDHDGSAGLRTACARQIVRHLGRRTTHELRCAQFVTEPPPSFGADGESRRHAVLSGDPGDPDLRVDFGVTRPESAAGERALEELERVATSVADTHWTRPGDLVVVDNRVTVHGRTAFRPRYDGRDRWVLRTFAVADLRRSRSSRPEDGYVIAR